MAFRVLVVALALAVMGDVSAAQAPAAAPAVPRPYRKTPYVQLVRADSARVLFELHKAAPATLVLDMPSGPPQTLTSPASQNHEISVTGLTPSTRYRYHVTVEGAEATGEIATAPTPGTDEPFTFVVYGDSREDNSVHRGVVDRIISEAPDFAVSTGDLVDEGSHEPQWQAFFNVEGPLMRSTPVFPALGNHDYAFGGKTTQFRRLFALPDGAPDGEAYYQFDWGASRFLVMDSNGVNKHGEVQVAWLEAELIRARADAKVRHVFVVMHHPVFSISVHGGDLTAQRRWAPLFTKYRVDAVFSGHDHVYQRLTHDGVLYMVSGGGGASLYTRGVDAKVSDKSASVFFERVHHFVRVQVRGDAVELSAIRDDGSLVETVRIGGSGVAIEPAAAAGKTVAIPATSPAAKASAAPTRAPARRRGCELATGPTGSEPILLVGVLTVLALAGFRRKKRR